MAGIDVGEISYNARAVIIADKNLLFGGPMYTSSIVMCSAWPATRLRFSAVAISLQPVWDVENHINNACTESLLTVIEYKMFLWYT